MTSPRPVMGSLGWLDLTVESATETARFYEAVAGWTSQGVDMGGYEDHTMMAADGTPVAGVCHARGINADLPAQWMVYIHVPDLDASLVQVEGGGGEVVTPPRDVGGSGRFSVIRAPAGALSALYQAKTDPPSLTEDPS